VRLALLANGAAVVAWIDEADPLRLLRVASLSPNGKPQQVISLDDASALVGPTLRAVGDEALVAYADTVASESSVICARFNHGRWQQPQTLSTGLWHASNVSIETGNQPRVSWTLRQAGRLRVFSAPLLY
jgi:hypothetical protein